MKSRTDLLTEAMQAHSEGRADDWWNALEDEEREVWWQLVEESMAAARDVVEMFRQWLCDPLTNLIEGWADWYENLPAETREALEAMGDAEE
jgi:hypothetical protein